RSRLTLIFVSLAVIPLIVVSAITAQRSFANLEREAVDLQNEVAVRVGAQIEIAIQKHVDELVLTNEVQGLRTLPIEDQRSLLSDLLAYDRAYQELLLVDSNGNQRIEVSRVELHTDNELVSHAGTDAFESAMTGEIYYSPVYIDEVSREPLLTVAVPALDL